MKTLCLTTIITALLLSIFGCNQKQSDQLTRKEKDQIKKEVRVYIDSLFAAWETLDLNKALSYYSKDMVKVGGTTLQDFQAYKKAGIDFLPKVDSVKFTEDHWECVVLSKTLVLSYWSGKAEWFFKSHVKGDYDPNIYTNIIKNENGQWKAIYEQYFGIPVKPKESTPVK
jgi:hypothetical protein